MRALSSISTTTRGPAGYGPIPAGYVKCGRCENGWWTDSNRRQWRCSVCGGYSRIKQQDDAGERR